MKDILLLILQRFAEQSDEPGSTVPPQHITVHMGGLLITGQLISHRSFMRQFIGGAIQEVIDGAVASGELQPTDTDAQRDYIHLQSARFFLPSQMPIPASGEGVLWRGRLDAVDGFTLGELRVGPPR